MKYNEASLEAKQQINELLEEIHDLKLVNHLFYHSMNMILQDLDNDKLAYGSYVYGNLIDKRFSKLEKHVAKLTPP